MPTPAPAAAAAVAFTQQDPIEAAAARCDDWLRALLSTVPSTIDVIWLRGDEVSLTPPRRKGGASEGGNKGGKRKVEVALQETATRPQQRRRRAISGAI